MGGLGGGGGHVTKSHSVNAGSQAWDYKQRAQTQRDGATESLSSKRHNDTENCQEVSAQEHRNGARWESLSPKWSATMTK